MRYQIKASFFCGRHFPFDRFSHDWSQSFPTPWTYCNTLQWCSFSCYLLLCRIGSWKKFRISVSFCLVRCSVLIWNRLSLFCDGFVKVWGVSLESCRLGWMARSFVLFRHTSVNHLFLSPLTRLWIGSLRRNLHIFTLDWLLLLERLTSFYFYPVFLPNLRGLSNMKYTWFVLQSVKLIFRFNLLQEPWREENWVFFL